MLNSNGKIISYILSLAFISTPHLCTQLCTFFPNEDPLLSSDDFRKEPPKQKNINLIILYNNYLVCSCNWQQVILLNMEFNTVCFNPGWKSYNSVHVPTPFLVHGIKFLAYWEQYLINMSWLEKPQLAL